MDGLSDPVDEASPKSRGGNVGDMNDARSYSSSASESSWYSLDLYADIVGPKGTILTGDNRQLVMNRAPNTGLDVCVTGWGLLFTSLPSFGRPARLGEVDGR